MRLSLDNFLYAIKQIVTGKNGAGTGTAAAADGGIKVDKPVSLTDLINPTAEFPVYVDSTGGTASTTFAAIAAGAAYAQADMIAVKNALAQIAKDYNALAAANSTISSGKVPAYTVPAGTNATVGIISVPIPRDYDEASDRFLIRLKIALANADAAITVTGTPSVVPLGGAISTKAAVTATLPFKTTSVALSTTEQAIEINLSGNGLTRDGLIATTIALVGTTTGNTNITGVEYHYDSTIVSYNETDATGDPSGGNLIGFGNPLR